MGGCGLVTFGQPAKAIVQESRITRASCLDTGIFQTISSLLHLRCLSVWLCQLLSHFEQFFSSSLALFSIFKRSCAALSLPTLQIQQISRESSFTWWFFERWLLRYYWPSVEQAGFWQKTTQVTWFSTLLRLVSYLKTVYQGFTSEIGKAICHPDKNRIDICVREKRTKLSDTKRLLEFWGKPSVCSLAAAKRKCRHPKNLIQENSQLQTIHHENVKTIYRIRVRYIAAGSWGSD